jgi:hypothetical protein
MTRVWPACAALGALLLAAAPATAQPLPGGPALRQQLGRGMDPAGRAMPNDVVLLDAMAARGDERGLTRRLKPVRDPRILALDINWERSRVYRGAGLLVAIAFAEDLWRAAALPDASPAEADGLRRSAASAALYAFTLIAMDGLGCGDVSAPSHRGGAVASQLRPILRYAATLPEADRGSVIGEAVTFESVTAPSRTPDPLVCSADASRTPSFLPQAQWRLARDRRRAQLPGFLTGLLASGGK